MNISQNFENQPTQESLEQKKDRIEKLYGNWKRMREDAEIGGLIEREKNFPANKTPSEVLKENGYPSRTKIEDIELESWKPYLNEKFIQDQHMYLLRGDHHGLKNRGFYTRTFGYTKLNTQQIAEVLKDPSEVGYFLFGNEKYLTGENMQMKTGIAQELAHMQSQRGGSSFISTTTNITTAAAGTGNYHTPAEQTSIYVLKIPITSILKSNTENFYGLEEDEFLVPDYILDTEILEAFPATEKERVFNLLKQKLNIERADVGL